LEFEEISYEAAGQYAPALHDSMIGVVSAIMNNQVTSGQSRSLTLHFFDIADGITQAVGIHALYVTLAISVTVRKP
jgi:hypothetical protein